MSFFVIFAPMKPWKNIVIVLFVTVILHACCKPQVQSCFQEDLLYRVESFYQQYPDSAKLILDTLTINVLPEKERAHYCLLKAKVRDMLQVHYSPDVHPMAVELYDLQGRLLCTQSEGLESIRMGELPTGTYTLRIVMDDGTTFSDKVVKQ